MSTPSPILKTCPDGRLGYLQNDSLVPVHISRCFPWATPGQFLSLRNDEDEELVMIRDPDSLDPQSKTLLEKELRLSGQIFNITAIQAITKEIELRCWEVTTECGERSFQTELDEWPRTLPDGALLIEDLYGDLYCVKTPETLDPRSHKILWPLLG